MALPNSVGTELALIQDVLKELYLPPVVEQLNNEVLLLQRLEKSDAEIFGKTAIVPLHTGRSGGVGARGEGIILPDADRQRYARASYDLKYLYGRVQVTGPGMAKTASERGSFLQMLKGELDGIRADLTKDLARQAYGSGDSSIAKTGVTTASTTVVLQSREAIDKGQIYVGMKVDIGTNADADSISVTARTVQSVNAAGPNFVISGGNVTTASGDNVSRTKSSAGAISVTDSYEITGLKQIVSAAAGSLGGINAATAGNEYWDNLRDVNGGSARALSVDLMMQGFNKVRRAGGEVSSIITTLGLQRAFFNLLQGQVRYVEPMTIKGGFSVLEFMNKPLIADIDAPWGEMYFLDEKFLKTFSNRDWHFLDEDGNILKWVVGYDAWEAVLARYMNLGASRRNVQFLLDDLTDTTGV